MNESLPERLAREACRRNFPNRYDLVASDRVPAVFSGLYQPVHDAVRAALDEAANVARTFAYVEECADDTMAGVHRAALYKKVAAAIEALK